MSVVIVPAYWRPDYIEKCLECLSVCKQDRKVWVFQDNREQLPDNRKSLFSVTTEKILKHSDKWDRFVQRPSHSFDMTGENDHFHPCSFNVFHALREAYESGADLIYLVADDVLVTPDFFKWHEMVQNDGDYFSTVAERVFKQFMPSGFPFNLEAYTQSPCDLMDGGMCWKREKLARMQENPVLSVRDHRFPVGLTSDEFRPMIPFVQRAYHVGRNSSAAYSNEFQICGDTDDIPASMPEYSYQKVFRVNV